MIAKIGHHPYPAAVGSLNRSTIKPKSILSDSDLS